MSPLTFTLPLVPKCTLINDAQGYLHFQLQLHSAKKLVLHLPLKLPPAGKCLVLQEKPLVQALLCSSVSYHISVLFLLLLSISIIAERHPALTEPSAATRGVT